MKNEEQSALNNDKAPENIQIDESNPVIINPEALGINVDIKEKIEDFKPKGRTMHDDSAVVKFLVTI